MMSSTVSSHFSHFSYILMLAGCTQEVTENFPAFPANTFDHPYLVDDTACFLSWAVYSSFKLNCICAAIAQMKVSWWHYTPSHCQLQCLWILGSLTLVIQLISRIFVFLAATKKETVRAVFCRRRWPNRKSVSKSHSSLRIPPVLSPVSSTEYPLKAWDCLGEY